MTVELTREQLERSVALQRDRNDVDTGDVTMPVSLYIKLCDMALRSLDAPPSARGSITPENIDEAVEAGQIIERLQRPVYQPLSEESFRAYEAARRRIAILRQIAAAPDEPQRAEPVFEKLAQEAASLLWEIPANAPNTIGLRGFDIAGRIEGAIKDKLAATQSAPPEEGTQK